MKNGLSKEYGMSPEFVTEAFKGDYSTWLKVAPEVVKVFNRVVTDFIPLELANRERVHLEWDFSQPTTYAVLLRLQQTGELAGFTYAKPVEYNLDNLPLFDKEQEYLVMDQQRYFQMQQQTADVGWTVILEQYRGRGGWTKMMDELEKNITQDGKFKYMIRNVRAANQYAQKVKRRYADRIMYLDDAIQITPLGGQQYLRVQL